MIATSPTQESLLSLVSGDRPIPLSSNCRREATDIIFDWSSFPCQGEELYNGGTIDQSADFPVYVPQKSEPLPVASSTLAQPLHVEWDCCEENPAFEMEEPYCPPPPSPRSSIQEDLDAISLPKTSSKTRSGGVKKKVHFSPVLQIRRVQTVLGDHPCCLGGMALQTGKVLYDEVLDLELYEALSRPKRSCQQLRMNYQARRDRLEQATGLSGSELLQQEYQLLMRDSTKLSTYWNYKPTQWEEEDEV